MSMYALLQLQVDKKELTRLQLLCKMDDLMNNSTIINHVYNKLKQICQDENITVIYSDAYCNNLNASGIYQYTPDLTVKNIILRESVDNKTRIPTFAHEIGHHFGIKYYNDTSEEFANKYVKTLFEKYFPSYICQIYRCVIKVYADLNKYKEDENVINEYNLLKQDPILSGVLKKWKNQLLNLS